MKLIKIAVFVCSALILGFSLFSCGVDVEEEPGTIEEMGNPAMEQVSAAHEAADPSDDEIVIYYYRPDGEYEPWAIWLWAFPDGDGSVNWPYTQDFEVAGGVGYMKFSMDGSDLEAPPVGQDGDMGFIIRQDSEWIKDGEQDRIWNVNVSNEIVVFSEDQESYAYGPYVPTFQEARMIDATQLRLELSGRHAVEPAPDSNGFVVRSADESIEYEIQDMVNFVYRDDRSRNYSDLYLVTLAQPVDPSVPLEVYHEEYLQPMRIDTSSLVVESAEQTIPPADYRLGAVYNEGSVEFRVWSPFARSITAQLYTESGASSPVYEVVLEENDATGVWTGTFSETDPEGMFYDYEVTSSAGVRTALDPYAMSMDAYRNEGGAGRGAIINMDAPEAQPPGGWEGHTDYALDQREDAIIYEMSVRDFTISPDSDVSAAPGTYNAFIEKLPYLQDLGITHIQLMPVLNFYYTDETDRSYEDDGTASDNNYNWGYDPHNYFTPEGWYASDATDPYARVRELRNLIKEIHAHDMGVLLDVVYNHMANPMLLEDIVPYYYFRRTPAGSYTSNSGCGNDIATSRTMARRLITDSIFHWVSQYNIDGFRFDLMGLMDTETVLAARELVAALPEKADILFEGEGWQMYNGPGNTAGMDQDFMTQTDEVAVFNDEIRDLLKAGGFNEEGRGLITGLNQDAQRIFLNLIGQPQRNYTADDPGDSMCYIAAHDGLTLHDTITHNAQLDESIPAQRQEIIRRIMLGNFFVLTSQSIPFLHGGQERGRTKPRLNANSEYIGNFIRNSYDSSDNINQLIWDIDSDYRQLLDYTRGLINIRRNNRAFRIGEMEAVNTACELIAHENRKVVAYSISYEGDTFLLLVNADAEPVEIETGFEVESAQVLADSDEASADGVSTVSGLSLTGTSVQLEGLTAVLLRL